MPYILSIYEAPTSSGTWLPVSHLHVELTPLRRPPGKLKYLAGAEVGAGAFVSDIPPEHAAAVMREALPASDA